MVTAADRIEDVRVVWERDLERVFAAKKSGARVARLDAGLSEPRVHLEKTMAERVHRVAGDAAERLGCTDPFILYQTPAARGCLTAQALLGERPFAVRLVGPVASLLDDAALAALIGHELGHWMALGPRATPPSILREAWVRGAPVDICELCTLASELTADRFSLIAARGELEAAVRLDVAIATFDSPRALGLRELDHLEQLRGRIERGEDELLVSKMGGYPTSAFRLYATWLFWRSDLHRELTGVGPGDLALGDVDAKLRAMCADRLSREPAPEARGAQSSQGTTSAVAVVEAIVDAKAADVLAGVSRSALGAGAALGGRARAAASSVTSAFGRFVDGAGGGRRRAATTTDADDDEAAARAASSLDEVDDLERRFRELEVKAALDAPAPKQPSCDDLEARFRELEEREPEAG